MLKFNLELNKHGNPIITKHIIIICDNCGKEWDSLLLNQIKGIKNYGKDLCRGCKQKEQIKNGIRGKQYVNAGIAVRKLMSGKTFEDMLEKNYLIKKEKIYLIIHLVKIIQIMVEYGMVLIQDINKKEKQLMKFMVKKKLI